MTMRTTAVFIAAVALMLASDASAAVQLTNLPSLDPFGADGQPAAYASYKSTNPLAADHPYSAVEVRSLDGRDQALGSVGASSLPFQISRDPRSDRKRLVYSQCVTSQGPSLTTCAILAQELQVPLGQPPFMAAMSDPAPGMLDRLPSAYGGAAAFARSTPTSMIDELRYTPAGSSTSQRLHGGPAGAGPARLIGVALRGTTVAYVWKRNVSASRSRYTLFTERVGQPRRRIVSLDSTRARIIGPVWHGARITFAVRRQGTSRLYDFAPGSQTFRSAPGPASLASFAIGGTNLLWQTASGSALSAGNCGARGCPLYRGALPRFRAARVPR
jgi:hypothetical protein